MMRTIRYVSFLFMLSLILYGCGTTNDKIEDTNEEPTEDVENEENEETEEDENTEEPEEDKDTEDQENNNDEQADEEDNFDVITGSTETETREVEGMETEVEVVNYEIQPSEIAYQLSDDLSEPEVNDQKITHKSGEYSITLEFLPETELPQAVSDLQEEYNEENFDDAGELEDFPKTENGLEGKMQHFTGADMEGFYVYDIDYSTLVVTYEFPVEGGDGMFPILEALGDSITVP